MDSFIYLGAVVSIVGNCVLAFLLFKTKKEVKQFYDGEAFTRDLHAFGKSLIKIERVDPHDVLLRSPREQS